MNSSIRCGQSPLGCGLERSLILGISKMFKRLCGFRQAASLAAVLAVGVLSGCETKSFLDPSEMGRYNNTPKVVDVLKNLDTGMDETADVMYANAVDPKPSDMIYRPSDYVIGKNDLLQISIVGLVQADFESTVVRRVSESGNLTLQLIGSIKAEGLTEGQLEQVIQQTYKDRQLILDARPSVVVAEARNRSFSISGSVARIGQYAMVESDFRLLDALMLAGGVTSPTGIENIYIIRKNSRDIGESDVPAVGGAPASQPTPDILAPRSMAPLRGPSYLQAQGAANAPAAVAPGAAEGRTVTVDGRPMEIQSGQMVPAGQVAAQAGQTPATGSTGFEFNDLKEPSDTRVIRVPYEKLKRGELRYNVVIRPQDIIVVPDVVVGEYYMGGHIARTGVYSLTARDITLRSAIIAAGMLDQLAIPERTEIVRKVSRFKKVYARVNLAKVMAGEEPDILLKPDDEIMVGTNAIAPFLAAFRNAFRITYGFGFLYDRNFYEADNNN